MMSYRLGLLHARNECEGLEEALDEHARRQEAKGCHRCVEAIEGLLAELPEETLNEHRHCKRCGRVTVPGEWCVCVPEEERRLPDTIKVDDADFNKFCFEGGAIVDAHQYVGQEARPNWVAPQYAWPPARMGEWMVTQGPWPGWWLPDKFPHYYKPIHPERKRLQEQADWLNHGFPAEVPEPARCICFESLIKVDGVYYVKDREPSTAQQRLQQLCDDVNILPGMPALPPELAAARADGRVVDDGGILRLAGCKPERQDNVGDREARIRRLCPSYDCAIDWILTLQADIAELKAEKGCD